MHSIFVVLPVLIIIPGVFFFTLSKEQNRRSGLVNKIIFTLFFLSLLTACFSGGMALNRIPQGICENRILRAHLWFGAAAFLLSFAVFILSLKSSRNNNQINLRILIFKLGSLLYFLSLVLGWM